MSWIPPRLDDGDVGAPPPPAHAASEVPGETADPSDDADRLDRAIAANRDGDARAVLDWVGGPRPPTSFAEALGNAPAAAADEEAPAIEGFEVLHRIGQGAMGAVYEAAQIQPPRRVAVKVMRARLVRSSEGRRLFDREVTVLSRLVHPGIAVIHAAGSTSDDRPYFAMELVDGLPLDRALAGRPIDEALTVVADVARAVHYAHLRGIVHLDLKPANVLVDRDDRPRILDFGLARLVEADVIGKDRSRVAGTVAYMSPEQARGDSDSIDARSDVWSMGVILFELLAGRLPFEIQHGDSAKARAIVATTAPPDLREHAPAVPADVAAIVRKALSRDLDERYQSALAIAEDIERFRAKLPVAARPATPGYVFRRFASRRRDVVVVAAVALVAVLGAVIFTLRALHSAKREATKFASLFGIVEETLAGADPDGASDPDVRLREVFDRLAQELRISPPADGEVHASLARLVGNTLRKLGAHDRADELLTAAVAGMIAERGENDADTALAMHDLGVLRHAQCRFGEADDLHRRSLAARERVLGRGHRDAVHSREDLAELMVAMGRGAAAEEFLDANVAIMRGRDEAGLARALVELGRIRSESASNRSVEQPLREGLAIVLRLHSEPHEDVARATLEMARVPEAAGDVAAAIALVRDALAMRETIFGPSSLPVADALERLAHFAIAGADRQEGIESQSRALAIRERLLGADHIRTLISRRLLGEIFITVGRSEEGLALLEEVQKKQETLFGYDSLPVAETLVRRSIHVRDHTLAATLDARALEIHRARLDAPHPRLVSVLLDIGRLELAASKFDDAAAHLEEALGMQRELFARWGRCAWRAFEPVSRLLSASGRTALAADFAREALEEARTELGDGDDRTRVIAQLLAECETR